MNEITNKHLFVTMIIIGVITIGLLLGQRYGGAMASYSFNNPLSATAFQDNQYYYPNTYYPSYNTTSTTYRTVPAPTTLGRSYTTTQYYTTYGDIGTDGAYDDNSSIIQGYVPAGCEGGTDYSTITNEPCG